MNREKVIKGLECCAAALSCDECPYNENKECNNKGFFYSQAIEDALALLKEQKVVVLCKDCKYDPSNGYPQEELLYWYPCKNGMRDQDWFCGYGKRR